MNGVLLACLSALGFGAAVVTAKRGLRSLDARAGAAISIPAATLLFVLGSPFALDSAGFVLQAALLFVLVGLFFPATVTLLRFESNDRLGPTVSSALSGIAPLFALLAAELILAEPIPAKAALASIGVAGGVGLLSWTSGAQGSVSARWALLLPVAASAIGGLAQALAKAGLLLWPNPFAAALIGYVMSCLTVITADRLPRPNRLRKAGAGRPWFVATGILNGGAVLLMYAALNRAPVSLVAPIIATAPLVTAFVSVVLFREEVFTAKAAAGSALIVASIGWLVVG